jgi:hypothetical protein
VTEALKLQDQGPEDDDINQDAPAITSVSMLCAPS